MISLNDTSIFVGQIKQLMSDFNLPLCKIGNEKLTPNSYYIHNDNIYYYHEDQNNTPTTKLCSNYVYGRKYLNITDNFIINNTLYDRATHEYLGKYLRFLRDYKKINLMSMYNCFNNSVLEHEVKVTGKDISFNNDTEGYQAYKIPVSLMDTYSISVHNSKNIEVCLYDANNETSPLSAISYRNIRIDNVFHYEIPDFDFSVSNNLYMLLKLPKSLDTSIVVLEGKYYDKYYKLNALSFGNAPVDLKIASQLLSIENTYGNYLLADRLVEYLTGNVICSLSEPYEIKRMQIAINAIITKQGLDFLSINNKIDGIWKDDYLTFIKYLSIKHDLIKYDSLGYIDKDVEAYLIANTNFDVLQFDFELKEDE